MYLNVLGVALDLLSATTKTIGSTSGVDTQTGTAGNDLFNATAGDVLIGGLGNDTFNLFSSSARIVENPGQGIDTAVAYYGGSIVLPANVENLVLKHVSATGATGNALDNVIVAGTVGAILDGKGGNDVLVGGAGADLFRITAGNGSDAIEGFRPGWDQVQLQNYGITSYGQLKSLATQIGDDVQFRLSGTEKLVIRDVQLSNLDAYDFGLPAGRPTPPPGYTELLGPGKVYTANGWYVLNNVWNPGGLTYGINYDIASNFSKTDLTAGTTFSWSFPYAIATGSPVRAYPNLIFGPSPHSGGLQSTDIGGVFPLKVADASKLSAAYDIAYSGSIGGFNVTFDIWLTSTPNGGSSTVTNEIMVWLHKGDFGAYGKSMGEYTQDGAIFDIYYNAGTDYTALISRTELFKGTLDIKALLNKLQSLGIVAPTEYIASVELGSEVVSGAGSLTIKNLDITAEIPGAGGSKVIKHATGLPTTTTVVNAPSDNANTGTAGDDVIVYDPSKGTTDGGAGRDTLVLKTAQTVNLATSTIGTGGKVINIEDIDASTATGALKATGSAGANLIIGSAYGDVIAGGAGDDTLKGGEGDDTLDGGDGVDELRGEQGDDWIVYDAADRQVNGGSGRDTLVLTGPASVDLGMSNQVYGSNGVYGFEDVDASGSSAAVKLVGSASSNRLVGSAYADTLTGGDGADTLIGGGGADNFRFRSLDDLVGIPNVIGDFSRAEGDKIDLTSVDAITGGGRDAFKFIGAQGFHKIAGELRSVAVSGGALVEGDINGDGVADFSIKVIGSVPTAADFLGSSVVDQTGGAPSNNTNTGTPGDDTMVYDPSKGITDGGAGRDTLVLKTAQTVDLAASTIGTGGKVINIEDIDASTATGALKATGSAEANLIIGSAYGDVIEGGAGDDTLKGGEGADTLDGGDGVDELRGEQGDDWIIYDAADRQVNGGSGRDTLVLTGFASVDLGMPNQVYGSNGVYGFEDVDASGSSSAVKLVGSVSSNRLVGSAYADTLSGGDGSDTLIGGGGADNFRFRSLDELDGVPNVIGDFSRAEGDKIDLSSVDAVTGGGRDAFKFIGTQGFHNIAGELRSVAVSGGALVEGDINGDGVADFSIKVIGSVPTAADFIL